MKLTILWSRLAGYTAAFFRELAQRHACEIQLFYLAPGGHLRFEAFDLGFCRESQEFGIGRIPRDVSERVAAFGPEAILMSGWNYPAYMRAARQQRRRGVPVVAGVDNPWRGDLRQRLACLAARWMLHPAITTLYVCGERQAEFARRLGFGGNFQGLYAADVNRFRDLRPLGDRPNRFLFVGRLVERKGIALLLEAYARYRTAVQQPMELLIAGRGPMEAPCRAAEGVELRPFVHPDRLPAHFEEGQCLILPSWLEHWGVVLHEAAAAGLPLIASDACGASVNYLRDGGNGFRVQPETDDLLRAMLAFHELSATQRQQMSEQSRYLGWSWSPELQAAHFLSRVRSLQNPGAHS